MIVLLSYPFADPFPITGSTRTEQLANSPEQVSGTTGPEVPEEAFHFFALSGSELRPNPQHASTHAEYVVPLDH